MSVELYCTRDRSGLNVGIEMMAEYYGESLSERENDAVYLYVEPYIEDPILDCMIDINEVIEAVNRLKDSRAPGEDQVPSEFFKYATREIMELIGNLMRRIFEDKNVIVTGRLHILFLKGESQGESQGE